MKNIFYILLLLPTIIFAQYPSNSGHKITLGEQTTADGLIYRGVAETDTLVRKPSIDTMAYMVLDTTTNIIWHYKKATSNAWLRLNLLPSDTTSMLTPYIERGDTASMLTPYWRSGRFSGVLPLLNGGTGSATQNFVDLTTNQTVGGLKTFSNIFTSTATVNAVFAATELGTAARYLNIRNTSGGFLAGTEGSAGGFLIAGLPAYYGTIVSRAGLGISANDGTTNHMTILSGGNVGIGTASPGSLIDVFKNSTDDQMLRFRNESGIAKMRFVSADISEALHQWTSSSGWIASIAAKYNATLNNQYLQFRVVGSSNENSEAGLAAATKMTILGNGNVGIGATTPQSLLQISNSAIFSAVLKVSDLSTESTGAIVLGDGGSTLKNVGIWRAAANSMTTYGNSLNLGSYSDMVFTTGATELGSQAERMRILATNGNVGIGTASPNNLLTLQKLGSISTTPGIDFRGTIGLGGVYNNIDANSGRIYAVFDGNEYGSARVTIAYPTGAGTFADGLSVKNGNVGIGTTSPVAPLHIAFNLAKTVLGDSRRLILDDLRGGVNERTEIGMGYIGAFQPAIIGYITTNNAGSTLGDIYFATRSVTTNTAPTERMRITSAGVVSISNLGSGAVTATSGVLSTTSDMTLKIDDGYIDNALEKISQLKPRYFYWKEESGLPTDIRQLGFYAQEVNQALGEETANTPKNENDKWGIYDRALIAFLTKAVQELSAQIDILKQEIINLKNK